MIIGIGSDLCDIRRIEETLAKFGERFVARCFTEIERRKSDRRAARAASYAKRFAAKEACAKALGTGLNRGVYWRDMGVVNLPSGQPTMRLAGGAAARLAAITPEGCEAFIHLTITDEAAAGAGVRHDRGAPGGAQAIVSLRRILRVAELFLHNLAVQLGRKGMRATNPAMAALIGLAAAWGLCAESSASAQGWRCEARGTTGAWGWGRSFNREQARAIALGECWVHTPRNAGCYITFCR